MKDIVALIKMQAIRLKYTDPDDYTYDDNVSAVWAGTKIIRKENAVPTSPNDGILVKDSNIKNEYQNEYFNDTGLNGGVLYYYRLFPYTTDLEYCYNGDNVFNATARNFFHYTGNYEILSGIIDNTEYAIYRLTTSGTLTLSDTSAKVFMTGGGGGGGPSYTTSGWSTRVNGAGGGGGYVATGTLDPNAYTIILGAGGTYYTNGSITKINLDNSIILSASGGYSGHFTSISSSNMPTGGNGGSGGAGPTTSYVGKGNYISTIPFGVTDLLPHSAGGGQGRSYTYENSGSGGSNGSDGGAGFSGSNQVPANNGGYYGGGMGLIPNSNYYNGNAFYYGGGGGGSAVYFYDTDYNFRVITENTSGYQGVVYIAIPA